MDDSILLFTGAFVSALIVTGVVFTVLEFRRLGNEDSLERPHRHNPRDRG